MTLTVSCTMSRRQDKRIVVRASNFSMPINSFFTVEIPDVMTPRTTTPTSSIELYTYDEKKKLLDSQTRYILLAVKGYNRLRQVVLSSSSPEVAARN